MTLQVQVGHRKSTFLTKELSSKNGRSFPKRLRLYLRIGQVVTACTLCLSIDGCICGCDARKEYASLSGNETSHNIPEEQIFDAQLADGIWAREFRIGSVQGTFRSVTIYDKLHLGE